MNSLSIEELRYFSREIVRELGFLDNPYKDLELNFAQIHLLLECERYGSVDQQTLTKNLRINKSYVSRLVKTLIANNLIALVERGPDGRSKPIMLTTLGQKRVQEINRIAQNQVLSALSYLTEQDQVAVQRGLTLYSQALKKARQLEGVVIRPIENKDNLLLSTLIKTVLIEFGANKPGCVATIIFAFRGQQ